MIIKKTFNKSEQNIFSEISGDFNQMHIDPVAARRFIYGKCVVHGLHLVMWALEEWQKQNDIDYFMIKDLKVKFLKEVGLDEEINLVFNENKNEKINILIEGKYEKNTSITFSYSVKDSNTLSNSKSSEWDKTPNYINSNEISDQKGTFRCEWDSTLFKEKFPFLYGSCDNNQLRFLVSTTKLVGMVCPGANSVYSELVVDFHLGSISKELVFQVDKFDSRFNSIHLSVADFCKIKCFYRPEPKSQISYEEASKLIKTDSFSNMKALVVGGTRGIGEVCTKLLVAGGADVVMTYAKGLKEAKNVYDECENKLDILQLDVTENANIINDKLSNYQFTHLFYFATPFINDGVKNKIQLNLLNRFQLFYVIGFLRTIESISNSLTHIFCPSSVFIDEKPKNMIEYVATKLESEHLCANMPQFKVLNPRVPRIATDQTNSLMPVRNLEASKLMLDYILELENMTE